MSTRRLLSGRGLVFAGVFTTVACTRSPVGAPVVRRDSAGVVIVETRAPRWRGDSPWVIASHPVLDLGRVTGDSAHEFRDVVDAARLPGGGIAVADQASGEIRFFSSDGAFLGSVGRQGKDPGEFEDLKSIEPLGDSLIAFDEGLNRISIVDVTHRVVARTVPLPFHDVAGVQPVGDSALVADVVSETRPGEHGRFELRFDAVLMSQAGAVLDTLLSEPGPYNYRIPMAHGGYADAPPLFPAWPQFAARGSVVYGGSARRMEIEAVTLAGAGPKRRIVRVPDYSLSLRAADVKAERNALLESDPNPLLRVALARIPTPATRPAYDKLLVDSLGYLWAEVAKGWARRNESSSWNIFAPNGEWLGALDLPRHFYAFAVGGNWILGDQLYAPHIDHPVLLRLTRSN